MRLGDDNSDNAAKPNNPSFFVSQDHEDTVLERLGNVEDEIRVPRASRRALKHAKLLFQTIRVEMQPAHTDEGISAGGTGAE